MLVLVTAAAAWLVRRVPAPVPPPERILELPRFESSVSAVRLTTQEAIAEADRQLAQILAQPADELSFAGTLDALDALTHAYARVWNRMTLLHHVSPDPELRDAAQEASVALERWFVDNIELGEALSGVVEAFANTDEAALLSAEDALLLEDTLADFRRNGLMSTAEERAQIAKWRGRLASLTADIVSNINADEGLVRLTRDDLEGLSEEQLQTFEYDQLTQRYLVKTALASHFRLVMRHAVRPDTRRRALAAELSRAMVPNAKLIAEVLELRAEIAQLLDYETWADYVIDPYMAGSVDVARDFIFALAERLSAPFYAEQLALRDVAREHLGEPEFAVEELGLEDIGFYSNLLLEQKYAIDEELVKQYFAEADVLARIFELAEELFAIELALAPSEAAWAEDVQIVRVSDAGTGQLLGAIYLDLHSRPGKYPSFATFDVIGGRRLSAQRYQAPVLAIIGNFPGPVGDRPSLWSLGNVETMLHELGHALHGVLTEANHYQQSGLAVPWDFVEVPSQLLERSLEQPEVLRRLAVHHATGEAMPEDLITRIIASEEFGLAHRYARQVGHTLIDFAIHTYADPSEVPGSGRAIYDATNAIFSERYYAVPEDTGTLASFEHLFAGYDAGYYSYAWSDAIVADLLSHFRASEQGFVDPALGQRLRREILAVGGSRPVERSIHAFLGRDWSPDQWFAELEAIMAPIPVDQKDP